VTDFKKKEKRLPTDAEFERFGLESLAQDT
jgi:hypothetical protein